VVVVAVVVVKDGDLELGNSEIPRQFTTELVRMKFLTRARWWW